MYLFNQAEGIFDDQDRKCIARSERIPNKPPSCDLLSLPFIDLLMFSPSHRWISHLPAVLLVNVLLCGLCCPE